VQQKVGDYFAACMNTDAIDALGDKPLAPRWRSSTPEDAGRNARQRSPVCITNTRQFFFGSGTGQDAIDSSLMIVELAPAAWAADRDYYTKTDEKSVKIREQYTAYIQQLLTLTGESAEQAKADADADAED
jgi:putative endopeptidase